MTTQNKIIQYIGIGLLSLIILQTASFLLFDVVRVNDREVAVITRFGKADKTIQGWGLKTPFIESHAVTYDTSIQSLSIDANSATSDQQTLTIKVNVQYRLDPSKAIDIYRIVKDQKYLNDSIIPPFVQEAVKASTTKYTAAELLAKRDTVKNDIQEALQNRLRDYYSTVVSVNLENIDWSPEYDKAIEGKVIAQQDAEKAKQTLAKAQIDSQILITQAQAEADANKIKAEALKQSPELLEKAKIDKWDGHLPQVTGANEPIINLNK